MAAPHLVAQAGVANGGVDRRRAPDTARLVCGLHPRPHRPPLGYVQHVSGTGQEDLVEDSGHLFYFTGVDAFSVQVPTDHRADCADGPKDDARRGNAELLRFAGGGARDESFDGIYRHFWVMDASPDTGLIDVRFVDVD